MKKLIFVFAAMFAMFACGGNSVKPAEAIDSVNVDSIEVVDSIDSVAVDTVCVD